MVGTISAAHMAIIRKAQDQVRALAKKHGVKVRKHPRSGIDVKYPNGDKVHYFGWIQLKLELGKRYYNTDTLTR